MMIFKKLYVLVIMFLLLGNLYIKAEELVSKHYDFDKHTSSVFFDIKEHKHYGTKGELPAKVDNSESKFFPPIIQQYGGSCFQAAGVYYIFTYEINRLRGFVSSSSENQYPTHFTWNFLNDGVGGGSLYFDGWDMIKENGCPNVIDFGGHYAYGGERYWLSGYEHYYNGMSNRVDRIYSIKVDTIEGLNTLKRWVYNRFEEGKAGGVAGFGAGATNYIMQDIASGAYEEGKKIITKWGPVMNHGMTFVGYDYSVKVDYNNDGKFTNDIDINDDGKIDLLDYEIGALILVNSWSTGWANSGKCYMMYRLLAESASKGGVWNNTVHVIDAKESYSPLLTMRVKVKYPQRNRLKISAGIANDINNSEPEHILDFPLFSFQGGAFPMQGGNSAEDETLELGLDITPLMSYVGEGSSSKIFLLIEERDSQGIADGEILEYEVIDYLQDKKFYSFCKKMAIENNSITKMSIIREVSCDKPEIITSTIPAASINKDYLFQLDAAYGSSPYRWSYEMLYDESTKEETFIEPENMELLITNEPDDGYIMKDLSFDFPFYGQKYNKIAISVNGSIQFDNMNIPIFNSNMMKNIPALGAYLSDLEVFAGTGDGIWFAQTDSSALVKWRTSYYSNESFNLSTAVEIFQSGRIKFYYFDEITEGAKWCGGISDGRGNFHFIESSNLYSVPLNQSITLKPTSDFLDNIILSESGELSGIPKKCGEKIVKFIVKDSNNLISSKKFIFKINDENAVENSNKKFTVENFPNPFNPATTIKYVLNNDVSVNLSIYNILGQKIVTLIDEEKKIGEYSIVWDGKDSNGAMVTSGTYFYKLSAGEDEKYGRMLLVK